MYVSLIEFIAFIFVFALMVTYAVFGFSPKRMLAYFATDAGKGALKGILMFTLGGALFAGVLYLAVGSRPAAAEQARWFTYGDIYLGLDYPKNISPQCQRGAIDDRLTSNGGIVGNVYRSVDGRFHVNGKYTHHSCAFNVDRNGYDAFGLEARYRFWAR